MSKQRSRTGPDGHRIFDMLTSYYEVWCKLNRLDCIDAAELVHRPELTPTQRKWLWQFNVVWDGVYELTRD